MKQGEKIKRIRQYRKMTMKEVGLALGFDEVSSSVRMAQYENSSRSPKTELLMSMAAVMGVQPERISPTPEDPIDAVIEHILWLDEESPDAFYEENARLSNFLSTYWHQRARLARHEISKTDFTEWKLHYNVDGKMKSLQERIETQEEALPSLQQSLQPYLQVQRYLRLTTEPPSMVEQEEMQANGKQREPVREKPIHCEPEHRKKRSNDLSL